jgi:hypothetical protein
MNARAVPRPVRLLLAVAAFAFPFAGWRLVWTWIAPDVLNRIGYAFWLLSSTEGLAYVARVNIVRVFLATATPLLLGIFGAGWTWKRLRPKR